LTSTSLNTVSFGAENQLCADLTDLLHSEEQICKKKQINPR